MSPVAEKMIERLDAARQQWWLFTLLTTCVLACSMSLGLFLAFMLCDVWLGVGQAELGVMFTVWMTINVALIVAVARRSARSNRTLDATARRIEAEYPELGSSLINLVQLSQSAGDDTASPTDRHFCDAAATRAGGDVGQVRIENAPAMQSRRGRFVHCMQTLRDLIESSVLLALLVGAAVYCHLAIPNWSSAAGRILTPWQFVPSVGLVEITMVTPEDGDTQVMIGSPLEVTAEIRTPHAELPTARLLVTPHGEAESELPMALLKDTVADEADHRRARYTLTIPAVAKPMTYRIAAGDSGTPLYTVEVSEKPTVEQVEVTYTFPAYLQQPSETSTRRQADLRAPRGTTAILRIRPSSPISEKPTPPHLMLDDRRLTGRVERDGRLMVVEVPMIEDGVFTIHMFNDAGHGDPNPRVNRIDVLPDESPKVELIKPPLQTTASPGATVPVVIRATDDHGLGRLRLEMNVGAEDGPATVVRQWNDMTGETVAIRRHDFKLDKEGMRPGSLVRLRAVAKDRRSISGRGWSLNPQETAGPWHTIHIVSKQDREADTLSRVEGLRTEVWKILEKQLRLRIASARLSQGDRIESSPDEIGKLRAGQLAVRTSSVELLESLDTIDETNQADRSTTKRVLDKLVTGEMLEAVRLLDTMVEHVPRKSEQAARLKVAQDRIIKALRLLLGDLRNAQAEILAEMESRPGDDLPDDSRQVLEEARDMLLEFLEQQKKIIEASEALAKKPVDDFREQDGQKLEQLAAIEDDWSRFLSELHNDLDRLPAQDFANQSIASDMVTIDEDLEMAKGALLEKAVDVAVPVERLAGEMAEELVANLEKWLPDTPDRERYLAEKISPDDLPEAPMAELPSQLEDLIGELLEEEEDLFDEIEDVASSFADSLDKLAAGPVMDGALSNMSAKGATGNRLPNNSEIGGRAGEGRSGKASGEFVGQEAVGKGGRKTPSRLTPDALLDRPIEDRSTEPTGGSTGGGRQSGAGAEGLEGPVPEQPVPEQIARREMQRLAGRQTQLRNRAESIDLQFEVMEFHRTDLKKLIEAMSQVERDLKAAQYENALRRREVLADRLGKVRRYLQGEFEVRRDTTSNLPAEIQKELLGSMRDPSPPGWEEDNREYFRRLTGRAEKGGKPKADGGKRDSRQ